ncbi:hypothetical protein [Methylocystis echinoides]|uniref:Uncharacterized protein n=1 Tax=Methylocystis echinoides TaxID=29468 RepID=A0A9W6LSZ1_9HYPH|nr:hypothetical protein [Methylocystis echinoides]GLI93951.1 hypothetical protein LMG27198_29430 [Methylocystis echinoides]
MKTIIVDSTTTITFKASILDGEFPKFRVDVGGEVFSVDCTVWKDIMVDAASESPLAAAYASDAVWYLRALTWNPEITPRNIQEFAGGDTLVGIIVGHISTDAWSRPPADLSEA